MMKEIEEIKEKSSGLANIIRVVATVGILAVGFGGLALMIVLGQPEAKTVEPEEKHSPLVETALVGLQRESLDIDVDGVVVPRREIGVAAEVGGQVIEKTDDCEAGKYVREGTLLVRVDPRDYQLEVRRLDKELKQAQVSLEELDVEEKNTRELIALAKDGLELQKKELARLEVLAKRGDQYVTDSAMDTERRNVLTARNALVTLESQLRTTEARRGRLEAARDLVQANLDKANLNLSRTEIKAPIDGMIVKDSVELDAYLSPGTVIATIEDVSKCDVRCNLRMDELYWIWNQPHAEQPLERETSTRSYRLPPTPTTVIYRMGDRQYEWNGILRRYDGIGLDETTRTVPCIVVVDKPDKISEHGTDSGQALRGPTALVRGMYVELKIHTRPDASLLQVPTVAIRPGNKIFRVRGGILNIITVNVISVMGDLTVVTPKQQPTLGKQDESLMPGDQVVVSQMPSVYNGMSVKARLEKRL